MFHVRIFTDSVSFTDISRFGVEGMRALNYDARLSDTSPATSPLMYGSRQIPNESLQGQLRNARCREHKGPIVVVESSLLGRGFKPSLPRWLAGDAPPPGAPARRSIPISALPSVERSATTPISAPPTETPIAGSSSLARAQHQGRALLGADVRLRRHPRPGR